MFGIAPREGNKDVEDDFELDNTHSAGRRPRHRPRQLIDWRGEICHFLDLPTESGDEDLLRAMEMVSERLQEADRLSSEKELRGPPRFQVLNHIHCRNLGSGDGMYLDTPVVVESGSHLVHLKSTNELRNLKAYLKQNKEVVCVVHRYFECCGKLPIEYNHSQQKKAVVVEASRLLTQEYIEAISDDLRYSLNKLSKRGFVEIRHAKFEAEGDEYKEIIPYPYLWWFHRRRKIEKYKLKLDSMAQKMIKLCQDYFEDRFGGTWAMIDSYLSQGTISAAYIEYLFVPGEILISKKKGNNMAQWESFCAADWLKISPKDSVEFSASLNVTHWTFNGTFQKNSSCLSIDSIPSKDQIFNVTSLDVYPLKFATEAAKDALRQRGKMFWECRRRKYVSYAGFSNDMTQNPVNSRFMIDTLTYRQMNLATQSSDVEGPQKDQDELPLETMYQDALFLGDSFYMCLPATIKGYHMEKKEWNDLHVGYIREVEWNDEAFNFLVIPNDSKQIIQALVTSKLNRDDNTDVIRGKGNGLIILLHGAPGTGKTLTAESVAEIARKPLYRVTCGDIGTRAEEAEKYFEAVLHLGKVWDCVVLLDEADVFLEQRSPANLERNALVSVFLRVLEYFEGIVILTSNRVGLFDEAFKSRIHVSLYYPSLDKAQRQQVWSIFIDRLASFEKPGSGIDTGSIEEHLDDLSDVPFNGREIRNAIQTARQLASFKNEPMNYKHLEVVMNEVNKFDTYTKLLNNGFTGDELARDSRWR